jgi:excisionase family DNA binding protein
MNTLDGQELSPLLSVSEVASLLSVSVARAYQLAERGELGHYKLGRSIRFSPDQVQTYLSGCRRDSVAV